MSVEYANRSWARLPGWLLLGFSITSGVCTRTDQNTREAVGRSGAEESGAVVAAPALASGTGGRPLEPEQPSRLMTVSNNSGSYSGEVPRSRDVEANGTVFVSTGWDDKMYALVDDDGDHEVDRVHVVARALDTRDWISHRERASFNAEISRVLGIDGFEARPDRLSKPVVVVTDKLPAREHHGWRYVRFGVGGWLYIPVRVTHQA